MEGEEEAADAQRSIVQSQRREVSQKNLPFDRRGWACRSKLADYALLASFRPSTIQASSSSQELVSATTTGAYVITVHRLRH